MPVSVEGRNQIPGYRTLEVDLLGALLLELTRTLDGMTSETLDERLVSRSIPEAQGVYQLFLDDELVYIGKTDSEAGLKNRLIRHSRKVQHRLNIRTDQIRFKAVRIFVFTAVDLEQQLIKIYKDEDRNPIWNNSGFGANDPGRKRDKTGLKSDHFDLRYPINIDLALINKIQSAEVTVHEAISWLNQRVPYLIRVEKQSRRPHADLEQTRMHLPTGSLSARTILRDVQAALPNWQVTVLPGYVIIYKEAGQNYPHVQPLKKESLSCRVSAL